MDKKSLRRSFTLQLWKGNIITFFVALAGTVMQVFLNLLLSWLLQQFVDVSAGTDTGFTLSELVLLSAAVFIAFIICSMLIYFSRPKFYSRAMRQYKDFAFRELTKKGISAFSKESTAAYISAFSNDAASIEQNYLNNIFDLVWDILIFFGAFAMMLWYSPALTAAAVIFAFLPVLASLLAGKRLAKAEEEVSRRNESFMSTLRDGLAGFSVVKSFKAEAAMIKLFARNNKEVEDCKCRRQKLSTALSMLGSGAGLLSQFGIFIICAYFAVSGYGGITPGVVIIFLQLMNFVISPISELPGILANRKAAAALIDKMANTIYSNIPDGGTDIPAALDDGIALKNISFSYDGKENVLKNINFKFEAGKSYAIVGSSGSGKSTLLNLLMAGSPDYSGEIYYDGRELRTLSSHSLYDVISIIQQNVFIFNSSIRENITMFREFDEAEVEHAIKSSGLSELVAERGADFSCGENGSALSGGERQRISIARSLLRKTPVLLVDEATASLDAETAFRVSKTILELEGLTRIVVTHSLDEALLRKYDSVLVLKNGTITEQGTFDELMSRREYFYSLFTVSQ